MLPPVEAKGTKTRPEERAEGGAMATFGGCGLVRVLCCVGCGAVMGVFGCYTHCYLR